MTPPARTAAQLADPVGDWLARTDTVRLVCRDKGHWWPSDQDALRDDYPVTGHSVITEWCQRGCGVSRKRYVGLEDGLLRKSSTYGYSDAPGYLMPGTRAEGWFMDKATRGRIRLALRERGSGATGTEV